MESHRSLTTTAALIHGAGEVELLPLLLLTLRMELAKLNYYYCSYSTLYVEPLKLTTTPTPT